MNLKQKYRITPQIWSATYGLDLSDRLPWHAYEDQRRVFRDAGFSTRLTNCLINHGIKDPAELVAFCNEHGTRPFLFMSNFGKRTLDELRIKAKAFGATELGAHDAGE